MASNNSFYNAKRKKQVIYSARAAGFLQEKGHILLDVSVDRLYPSKSVYIFANSKQLHNDLDEYTKQQKENKKNYT